MKKTVAQRCANAILIFLALRLRVLIKGFIVTRRLERAAKRIAAEQAAVLKRILNTQKNTEYGKANEFENISTPEQFRQHVPINDYEDLRPWIEKQEATGEFALNHETPEMYTLTSGTTGKPKLIPVLHKTMESNRKIQNLFLTYLFKARPRVADGHLLTIVSPAVEGHTENAATPFGATTGHMYASTPRIVQRKYVVPPAIYEIEDYDLRFHLILRLSLQYDDITYMTTANPTTFTRLIQVLNEKWDQLIFELEVGGFPQMESLTADQQSVVNKFLVADPERAEELRAVKSAAGARELRFADVWKDIQAVGVWTGGSSSIFYQKLKKQFNSQTLIRDLGYHSSEFRGSSPIFEGTPAGIPTFREHYFEFVEREAWDGEKPVFLGLHELEDGKEYYLFVTTDSGLYRYNMNDVVIVDGFYHQVPRIRFLQKGKGVTSITGEKLYENQVIQSVNAIESKFAMHSSFYMMIANVEEAQYSLYYEGNPESLLTLQLKRKEIEAALEAELAKLNIEYETKRKSDRIKALRIIPLNPGTYEAYKRHCIAQGQRESQFKIIALYYKHSLDFDLSTYEWQGLHGLPDRIATKPKARMIPVPPTNSEAQL